MRRVLLSVICVWCFVSAVNAQKRKEYHIVVEEEGIDYTLEDSLSMMRTANELIIEYWNQGYIYSGIDSVAHQQVYIHKGQLVELNSSRLYYYDRFVDSLIEKTASSAELIGTLLDRELSEYINNGYPFAQIKVENFSFDGEWQSTILVDPGPYVEFDSLVFLDKVDVGNKYIQDVLNIRTGKPYSEKVFQNISKRMERLPYLTLREDPDVTFKDGKTRIYLKLKETDQSAFEGVLGILPNQSTSSNLSFTGYLDLKLANLFKSGKGLNFTWNRFADESQSVDITYAHPYLFSSPLFLQVDFNLLKQDTSFLTQTWQYEAGTYIWNTSEIFFGINVENGRLIDVEYFDPDDGYLDYRSQNYHIGLRSAYYDQPFSYGSHFKFFVSGAVGEKEIKENLAISSEVYDTLNLNTTNLKLYGKIKYQLSVFKSLFLYHEIRSQYFQNGQILTNELSRMGGLKSIRGFNENFFYAKDYVLSRLELRQFFESKSYVMLFYDLMYLNTSSNTLIPQGMGLGLTLNTSNGLFTFVTAVGSTEDVALSAENIKIHIGYISTF